MSVSESHERLQGILRDKGYCRTWEFEQPGDVKAYCFTLECWIGTSGVKLVQAWPDGGLSIFDEDCAPAAWDELEKWLDKDPRTTV